MENLQTSYTVWHLPKDHNKAIGTVQQMYINRNDVKCHYIHVNNKYQNDVI